MLNEPKRTASLRSPYRDTIAAQQALIRLAGLLRHVYHTVSRRARAASSDRMPMPRLVFPVIHTQVLMAVMPLVILPLIKPGEVVVRHHPRGQRSDKFLSP
ncbi:MAG: hypothetical protein GPOALKHO_001773 [Sodalis sp.]|nr:MAG: hypothetical protein GPOALKHO_001773 [Sodalis sp.]